MEAVKLLAGRMMISADESNVTQFNIVYISIKILIM